MFELIHPISGGRAFLLKVQKECGRLQIHQEALTWTTDEVPRPARQNTYCFSPILPGECSVRVITCSASIWEGMQTMCESIIALETKSGRRGSNPRRPVWEAGPKH